LTFSCFYASLFSSPRTVTKQMRRVPYMNKYQLNSRIRGAVEDLFPAAVNDFDLMQTKLDWSDLSISGLRPEEREALEKALARRGVRGLDLEKKNSSLVLGAAWFGKVAQERMNIFIPHDLIKEGRLPRIDPSELSSHYTVLRKSISIHAQKGMLVTSQKAWLGDKFRTVVYGAHPRVNPAVGKRRIYLMVMHTRSIDGNMRQRGRAVPVIHPSFPQLEKGEYYSYDPVNDSTVMQFYPVQLLSKDGAKRTVVATFHPAYGRIEIRHDGESGERGKQWDPREVENYPVDLPVQIFWEAGRNIPFAMAADSIEVSEPQEEVEKPKAKVQAARRRSSGKKAKAKVKATPPEGDKTATEVVSEPQEAVEKPKVKATRRSSGKKPKAKVQATPPEGDISAET